MKSVSHFNNESYSSNVIKIIVLLTISYFHLIIISLNYNFTLYKFFSKNIKDNFLAITIINKLLSTFKNFCYAY